MTNSSVLRAWGIPKVCVTFQAVPLLVTPVSLGEGLQLNRLVQLSGLSDPVYVEAYVTVGQWLRFFLLLLLWV